VRNNLWVCAKRFNDICTEVFSQGLGTIPPDLPRSVQRATCITPQGISDVFGWVIPYNAFDWQYDNSTIRGYTSRGGDHAKPCSSAEKRPAPGNVTIPGTYNINLILDEGNLISRMSARILYARSASLEPGNDTLIAAGSRYTVSG